MPLITYQKMPIVRILDAVRVSQQPVVEGIHDFLHLAKSHLCVSSCWETCRQMIAARSRPSEGFRGAYPEAEALLDVENAKVLDAKSR
jgi:hypothetical protein